MNESTQKMIDFVVLRLQERSTWRSIAMIVSAALAFADPAQAERIILLGMGLSGLIGIFWSDYKGSMEARRLRK